VTKTDQVLAWVALAAFTFAVGSTIVETAMLKERVKALESHILLEEK
jgi:hypothetical protein